MGYVYLLFWIVIYLNDISRKKNPEGSSEVEIKIVMDIAIFTQLRKIFATAVHQLCVFNVIVATCLPGIYQYILADFKRRKFTAIYIAGVREQN